MELNEQSRSPLTSLIETIVEKKNLTTSEQVEINKLAAQIKPEKSDLAALTNLTNLISQGVIKVS